MDPNRREFVLGGAGVLAAGMAWASAPPTDTSKILNYNPAMNYRTMGKTNLVVSELSLGGHWRTKEGGRVQINFPDDKVPDDVQANRNDVVSHAIDMGINYVDITTSAEAIAYGEALKGRREKMYVGYSDVRYCFRRPENRTPEGIMREIDEGLRMLQSDYMDIYRNQLLTNGQHTDAEMELLVEVSQKAIQQGKVRHLGLSTHSRDFCKHLMEEFPEFEMMIFPFQGFSEVAEEDSVFPLAKKKNVGIATIKPFSGGSLFENLSKYDARPGDGQDLARLAVRQILGNEYLSCMLPGMTTIEEMDNNIRAISQSRQLNEEEKRFLDSAGEVTIANLPPDYRWLRGWVQV